MRHCPTCGQPWGDEPDPLTPTQLACLQVVVEWIDAHDTAPSVREIMREIDLASPASVHRLLTGIVKKGWLRRAASVHNGLTILHRPPMPDFSTPEFSLGADVAGTA